MCAGSKHASRRTERQKKVKDKENSIAKERQRERTPTGRDDPESGETTPSGPGEITGAAAGTIDPQVEFQTGANNSR